MTALSRPDPLSRWLNSTDPAWRRFGALVWGESCAAHLPLEERRAARIVAGSEWRRLAFDLLLDVAELRADLALARWRGAA